MTEPPLRWTDNHCHLGWGTDGEAGDAAVAEALADARADGVERFINVGTDLHTSTRAVEVADANDGVWATAGVHPHDAEGGIEGIAELLGEPKVMAVGECGLDYHYDNSPREAQKAVFASQIQLAHGHGLPLVIHTREAWDDTFAILDTEGVPASTIFHCFTGGAREAELALERGAWISFSGIVTFKSAHDLRAAAAVTPLDRLLVETDAPYLAPVPNRGKDNRPAWVPLVGAGVAGAKDVPVADVARASWDNAEKAYGLVPGS